MMPRSAILGVVSLLATVFLAGSAYPDEVADWPTGPWSSTTHQDSREFEHKRVHATSAGNESLTWAFDLEDARLVSTYTDSEGNTSEVLDVRLDALVEFRDLDGDNRFSLGDAIIESFSIADVGVKDFRPARGTPEAAEYVLQSAWPATIVWEFDLPDGPLAHNATVFSMRLHVDDYASKSSNGTHLALLLRVADADLAAAAAVQAATLPLVSHVSWSSMDAPSAGVTFQPYLAPDGREALLALSQPSDEPLDLTLAHDLHKPQEKGPVDEVTRAILGNPWLFLGGLLLTLLLLYGAYRLAARNQGEVR